MKHKQSVWITGLFCLFLGAMALLTLLLPPKKFSELENRNLEPAPKLSAQSVSSGRFMKDAENWGSDHVVLRDRWVQLKALAERLSGKLENNGVCFAGEDTLLRLVEEPDETQVEKNISAVRGLIDKTDIPVRFGLIPTAASIWADRLPVGIPTLDETAWIDRLYREFGGSTLDLQGTLDAHKAEPIFYRTDHHWTTLGARYAADVILEALELDPLREEELQPRTVSEDFYGTVYSRAGAWWVKPDEMTTMVPEEGIEVTSNFTGKEEPGSLYVPAHLAEKNKYAFFLGGNQPVCVIRTQAKGPKLLLIRDSYSDSLVPFLALRCSEIHLLDLRYYRLSVPEYIEDHDIDQAVVLYGLSMFLEDRNLYLLRR